jgi:hypothetical protein
MNARFRPPNARYHLFVVCARIVFMLILALNPWPIYTYTQTTIS